MTDRALQTRKNLLSRKLIALGRLKEHLEYSRTRLPYPLASVDHLDAASLESVSALIERFGKLRKR